MKEEDIVSFDGIFETTSTKQVETYFKRLHSLMESEIVNKQKTIELLQSEIIRLRKEVASAQESNRDISFKLQDAQQKAEGNRQLVNKLLNEMERMQQDIEWYKRTYENRSLFGTLREKILNHNSEKP